MTTISVTERQRELVAQSFARLVPISAEAASVFYEHLWAIAPETKALFANTDMPQQGLKLMQTLGLAVRALHNRDEVVQLLQELGRRHIGYGTSKEHYPYVGAALIQMIESCLKDDFTPELREAWTAAYETLSTIAVTVYQ